MSYLASQCQKYNLIDVNLYSEYDVKRGLRDLMARGLSRAYDDLNHLSWKIIAGKPIEACGELRYRGIDINELVAGFVNENALALKRLHIYYFSANCQTKQNLRPFIAY